MATVNRLEGDLVVSGTLFVLTGVDLPDGSLTNTHIEAAAGISASKIQQHHSKKMAQAGTAVTATEIIHVLCGLTGTLKFFKATNIVACIGAATVTVDLKKNGTTVLSAVLTLDSSTGARGEEVAVISSASVVADDVLEVVLVATAGGGTLATEVYAELRLNEDYPLV